MIQLGPWLRRSVPARALAALALVVALTSACGGPEIPPIPLPTFAPTETASVAEAGAAVPADPLPGDCGVLLSTDELTALMGRPLGSVGLRTVRGVPEPDVERIARLSCRYTATDAAGTPLLTMNVARYASEAAAARQWALNSEAERAGLPSRDTAIGAARAVLVEEPDSTALILTYSDSTITFVRPAGPPAAGRAAPEFLVDLALRVIPRVVPPAPGAGDGTSEPPARVQAAAAG